MKVESQFGSKSSDSFHPNPNLIRHCAGPSLYRLISYILVVIIRHLVYGGEDNFTQHLYNIDNICRNSIKYR